MTKAISFEVSSYFNRNSRNLFLSCTTTAWSTLRLRLAPPTVSSLKQYIVLMHFRDYKGGRWCACTCEIVVNLAGELQRARYAGWVDREEINKLGIFFFFKDLPREGGREGTWLQRVNIGEDRGGKIKIYRDKWRMMTVEDYTGYFLFSREVEDYMLTHKRIILFLG